jgi:hypothetical protein
LAKRNRHSQAEHLTSWRNQGACRSCSWRTANKWQPIYTLLLAHCIWRRNGDTL